ncbi:MAG: ATP-binding cassette domain-containing protein [Alphaproteobacteria bacterium]|jgi:ATP-binding cassette subfamily F protein uup|nr:ATP-binding cassette domain-containing protein [Alphaproteobacteria bacterium]
MAPPILFLRDIDLSFGGTPLLQGAALSVSPGERPCLVGRNGSGKSTLLKIAAGLIEADSGERFVQPGTTVRYLPQEPDLSAHGDVLSYVKAGLAPGDDPHRAAYLLQQLGLRGDETPAQLSGGELRRAALARVLAPEPDILMLDEPTNHLDLPAIEWLEEELRGLRSAVIMVSHDRRFLANLSRATIWLNLGETRQLNSGFADFEAWRDDVLQGEEEERHKLDRKIVREEHWLTYGVTARRKRNQRRLRDLHALRQARRERPRQPGDVKMAVTESGLSGKLVAEAKGISKSYGGNTIVADFSSRIQRGDRVGIVGPNGAGKTTLLNMLTGALTPDKGSVRLGANLAVASLDQRRESLDPDATLSEALTGGSGDRVSVAGQNKHVIGYMKDFLFQPEQIGTVVSALSGGERGRLMLARALAKPSNLLLLDEPTNDLDLETLDLLQEMLADYPGTVLLVSHDRDFLDRVVTSVIAYEGEGTWLEYAGGYSDMLAQRGTAGEAKTPTAGGKQKDNAGSAGKAKSNSSRKMSFKDKHALDTLPARLDALATEIAELEQTLADPAFYGRDPGGFDAASARLTQIMEERAAAEEQWLTLELLREELEGGL